MLPFFGTECSTQHHPPKHTRKKQDGTLTVPVIDFAAMRARVGVPDGADILDYIASRPEAEQAAAFKAIQQIEDQALHDMQAMPGAVHEECLFIVDFCLWFVCGLFVWFWAAKPIPLHPHTHTPKTLSTLYAKP